MKIDFGVEAENGFYDSEIERAIKWLLEIRDVEKNGWAWVQFIAPNEQNTAEVIATFVEYMDILTEDEGAMEAIVESIKYWLLDVSHAKISIDYCWVLLALQKVRTCPILYERIETSELNETIIACLEWLCKNRNNEKYKKTTQLENSSGVKGCGWGDNETEVSNTIRTALAVLVLNREIKYLSNLKKGKMNELTEKQEMTENRVKQYREAAKAGTDWLLAIQNDDGGWGNLDKRSINRDYEKIHSFSYADLQYQCDSNAACTGYVMLALVSDPYDNYARVLRKAAEYIKSSQMEDGRWIVFSEIGIRDGKRYTFRHFSTAWAIQGLIVSKMADYTDECVINGFSYLTTLQDENYGGWKSSSNADNYTWATCNALDTIKLLKESLSDVQAKQFLRIVCEWWDMKKKETSYSMKIGGKYFAFNGTMCCAFCITFSVMVSLILYVTYDLISPVLMDKSTFTVQMIYSIMTIIAAFVFGLPWIVFVKKVFRREEDGWIDSIGWVYGIITGFVLVFYQFIL